MKRLLMIAVATLSVMTGSIAAAATLRADWMAGKRGMMVHWLFGEPGRIDYYVNAFDINRFMEDFDATRSDYLVFTVGQNTGAYASPNSKITEYAGAGHCPVRDLVGEIAAAVHARGKRFIAYLPCELNANTTLHAGFGWPAAGSGKDMEPFQTRWLEVITEWATRWGSNLDGWWIDGYTDGGTHWPDAMSTVDEARWAAALRAGNANAVITFNNGLAKKTPRAGAVLSDYLAGEINSPSALNGWTLKEFADDSTCRTHFLMPIDGFWGGYWSWDQAGAANPYSGCGLPNQQTMDRLSYVGRFPDPVVSESDLSDMISAVFAVHGAVTVNIGVSASGTLNPASVALLAKMPGGSASTSAPKGTTVESMIGSWISTPMANDGSTFSQEGELVYAYCTATSDRTVNGVTFTGLGTTPGTASADFEFSPAFNTTQNADSDGTTGDLEAIARLAWKNSEKATKGYATMAFKGLTAGRRYCIQLYVHDTYCHNAAVFGPDAKSTAFYRSEENDQKTGKDWTCGGVFTGVITAKGPTHEITLSYPTADRIELNALQVRCLGDAGGDPDPVGADPDTSWMKGSFGVSFHWTAKIVNDYGSRNWEQAVANFNVRNFADSVESFGAKHVIFTVAHAWQQMPCPCAALDAVLAGRTTTRDLMKDIIGELTNRNIRVVFYYNHSCNHNEDSAWQAASGYNDITDEATMAAFGSKICSIVRELSLRYGDGVSAWWFDSATSVDDSEPWPNSKKSDYVAGLRFPWDDLFAAARAGNPHAAVAVNWDVGATDQHGLVTDYLSGETEKIDVYGNLFPFAPEGLQDHVWTRMDSSDWFWQGGDVGSYGSRFGVDQLAWWKVSHRDAGRMATLNLVIDEAGNINPVVAGRLVNAKTIGKVWSQGRYDPTRWAAAPAASNLIRGVTGEFTGNRTGTSGGYHDTPMSVLTDGSVPNTEIVAGGNLNSIATQIFGSKDEGDVFAWTLPGPSDIYGLNIYSRSGRSQYNGAKDGGNDAIVVTKVEVKTSGSSEWSDVGAPDLSFGKQDGISGGALAAKLSDGTGAPLARSVTAIRFTQGAPENNASLLVECEVIGCPDGGEPSDHPDGGDPESPGDDPEDPGDDPEGPGGDPEGSGGDPEDPPPPPQPGELVNGRADMKGWSMKRISTTAAAPAVSSSQSWSGQSIAGLYTSDPSDKYSSLSATSGEIMMTFGEAVVANTIQLFAPKESTDCMASAFTVSGSNDGSSWTELLSVVDETDWFARECRYYTFENGTAYTRYRLAVSAVNGGSSLKLGVFNYFFARAADPVTPWTWAGNVLSRGDQSINNVSKGSDCLSINYNNNFEDIYDLDLTAGIVDADGAKIDLPVKLNTRFKGSGYLTRVVAPKGICQVGDYGFENCYMLNEVVFGEDFTTLGKGAFKKPVSLQFADFSRMASGTLPGELFTGCYNLKGDLVFLGVTDMSCRIQETRVTSVSLPSVQTLGFADNWVAPFGNDACLTNIVLGENLTTIVGGQIFGKLKSVPVSVYWKSVPPTFTYASANLHGESSKNVVTHYLPWSRRAEWQAFAAQNPHPNGFDISLPDDIAGEGYWKGSGSDELVRWWNDVPPQPKSGSIMAVW